MHANRLVVLRIALGILWLPATVFAQPLGWALEVQQPWDYGTDRLIVVNLDSGAEVARFEAPLGVRFGNGGVTPDGHYYLLATSAGLARYRTHPPAFDRNIGPAGEVTHLSLAPIGARVHLMGPHGRAVVDWESAAVISVECCDAPVVYFTPDGSVRIHHRFRSETDRVERVAAFAESTGILLWEHEVPLYYSCGPGVAGSRYFALHCTDWDSPFVYLWDISTGAEGPPTDICCPTGLAWHGERLLLSHHDWSDTIRLSAYDPQARTTTMITERPSGHQSFPAQVTVSPDGRRAYWQTHHFAPVFGTDLTIYDVIDLASGSRVGSGQLNGFQDDFDISLEPWCDFGVPALVAAPVEGGVVNVPVVPSSACPTWSVLGQPPVLNPGPHVGPATILVRTWANTSATPKSTPVVIGRQTVLITQPSGVPAAPALEAAVVGDRVALSWTPAIGAGITGFVVRGAVEDGAVLDLLQLPAHLRNWTSPPLLPGSYEVELVAANGAGRSAASNRRAFSIGASAVPEPPTGLTATVADDRVALSWRPALTLPAPSAFVVEAAANGSTDFAPVARTDVPSFVATRVPAGTWQVFVRSATAGGVSEPSAVVTVTTVQCTAAPPGPPLDPWAVWTPPTVSLRWSPPSTGSVDEYVIEVGSASGRADLGQLVVPSTRLTHTEEVSALAAFVRVRARNACGTGTPSQEIPVVIY
jgi:hypothetical protein